MAVIQPKIEIPDDIYANYLTGKVDIKGLAVDSASKQIVKHLSLADDDTENDAENSELAEQSSGENELHISDEAFGWGFIITAIAGICTWIGVKIHKSRQEKIENFKNCLYEYIKCVCNQSLTVGVIDDLINAIDSLKKSMRKKISIQLTTGDLTRFAELLCQHTQNLESLNNIAFFDDYTDNENKDFILKLRKNLVRQKAVFEQVA